MHEMIDLFIIRWTGFVSVVGFLVSLILVGLAGKIVPSIGSHWTLIAEGMTILTPVAVGMVVGPLCGVPFCSLGPFARFNISWNILCILIWAQISGWFGWPEHLAARWAGLVFLTLALAGAVIWFGLKVHDNVTLTGGNQTLHAPTLPSVPAGYTTPTWETNGDYRLATLNASTEMPCLIAWQYERAQNNLAGSSVDEWLLENVRADNAYAQVAPAGSTYQILTTGNASDSGGTYCGASLVDNSVFSQSTYATNPRTLWFAGQYTVYSANGGTNNEAAGLAEFPIDPRSYTDPSHATWR